jgi:hypothetical protein
MGLLLINVVAYHKSIPISAIFEELKHTSTKNRTTCEEEQQTFGSKWNDDTLTCKTHPQDIFV